MNYFLQQDSFVFDIEGQGDYRDQPHIADISWISLATKGCCITIPLMHERGEENGTIKVPETYKSGKKIGQIYMKTVPVYDKAPKQIERSRVFEILRPLFASTTIAKAGHDVLYDIVGVSKYLGFIPPPPYNDTKIGKWLLNENNRRNTWLKEIIEDTYEVRYDHEGIGKCVESYPFSTVAYYSYSDAKWDWLVLQDVLKDLESQGLMPIYNLEMHVLNVMCGMRVAGVSIDVPRLKEIREELKERLVKSEAEIYQAAGKKFNIGSNLQKTEILFGPESDGNQGLKPWKLTKTGMDLKKAGKLPNPVPLKYWSTDDTVMESYPDNRLCCAFRDHGDIAKILSTYVESWLGNDEDLPKVIDSKIHAGFQQYGTVTGRFSCVSADTLVESPRDMSKFPDGIPITEIKTGDWVYAFDHKRELRLRKVVWCGQTGVKKTLIVTAENSEGHQKKIRVTPEHLIMLRNGDWRAAEHLMHAPGELRRAHKPQIMTMVRRNIDGSYIKFFPNAQAKGNGSRGGGHNREHRWIMSEVLNRNLSTKYDVDHIDGNKLNNHPENLRYVPSAEHRGNRTDFAWGTEQPEIELYSGKLDYRVISIEDGPVEPVWDMEVEELHNFIANGICVHNCRAPNLQNLPRSSSELGKMIRDVFIAEPGGKLVVADYSQMELVILAHYIGEGKLYEAFMQGIDPHLMTAAMVLGREPRISGPGDGGVTPVERQDLGKAQPLYSKILTPDGWTTMGEIKVGDIVCAPSGGETRILNVFPQGHREVYKILFSDGTEAECDRSHLWKVNSRYSTYVLTTEEILNSGLKQPSGAYRWSVPITEPLEFKHAELPVDPYVVGALLGDGCFTQDRVVFTTAEDEMVGLINERLPEPLYLNKQASHDYDYTVIGIGKGKGRNRPSVLRKFLNDSGLAGRNSHSKFIPQEYLFAAKEQRYELLKGLMDTDGYAGNSTYTNEFTTVSGQLAEDVAFLVRSLGGEAKIKRKKTSWTHNGVKKFSGAYRLYLRLPECPFKLTRKINKWKKSPDRRKFITGIQEIGVRECQCILVDHPDHMYITDGVTPTHNTLGFAVVYGAGLGKVSSMAHISFDEAKRVLKMHEKMFPEVHEFKQDVIDLARSRKPVPYITTLLGRKRRIPELNSSNDKLRMGAERQMFNSLIQGGLADLIKLAMIRLDATLPDEAKLVLTVHDEVVVSCPDSMVTEVENLVREAMTGPGIQKYLRVPMKIEMHSGDSWGECK